jgi:hypothetical protein
MNYQDFSSVFPKPRVNYPCTLNPNPGFTPDCIGLSQPTKSSDSPPATLPSLEKTFTLYKWALPITIPSTIIADDTTKGNASPDTRVSNFWIKPPYVSSSTYTDIYPDPDPTYKGQPFRWNGFKEALSKCIELDGSTYTPSNNICSSSNKDKKCIDPLLAYPNIKPKCYAVATQSDYTGNESSDTSRYTLNYFLVEEPNSSEKTSLSEFNKNIYTSDGQGWVKGNKIDSNYLFCQSQFYTWIKNTPSGTPYNPNTCTPVVCPNGPVECPTSSPSSSSDCVPCTPVTCPIGAATTNFNVASCSGPIYSQNKPLVAVDFDSLLGTPPPSFYEKPTIILKPAYVAPPTKETPKIIYIVGGVVSLIIIIALYFVFGPGADNETVIVPLKKTVKKLKKIGGYFNYGE